MLPAVEAVNENVCASLHAPINFFKRGNDFDRHIALRLAVVARARRDVIRFKIERHQLGNGLRGAFTLSVERAIENHAENGIREGRIFADAEVSRLVSGFDCAAVDFRQRVPTRH